MPKTYDDRSDKFVEQKLGVVVNELMQDAAFLYKCQHSFRVHFNAAAAVKT